MKIEEILRTAVENEAADIFLIPGMPAAYRVGGRIINYGTDKIFPQEMESIIKEFNFDITGQLSTQPRGGKVCVSGLRIEDNESSSGSGFDVDMDDWGSNEDIDLPVGGQQ